MSLLPICWYDVFNLSKLQKNNQPVSVYQYVGNKKLKEKKMLFSFRFGIKVKIYCYVQVYVSKINLIGKPIFCKKEICMIYLCERLFKYINCIYVCQESDICIKLKQGRGLWPTKDAHNRYANESVFHRAYLILNI